MSAPVSTINVTGLVHISIFRVTKFVQFMLQLYTFVLGFNAKVAVYDVALTAGVALGLFVKGQNSFG